MTGYYGYTWAPGSVRVAEHDTYVPEGTTHLQRVTDFSDADKVAHIRVLWPMIQGLDATKIADLAQSWRLLSSRLTTAKSGLDRAGGQLDPQWTGEASRAFLERVGAALFSLDQWIDAASTNAATLDRLADDVRTTQPRVEGIYRAWLMESATERAKRDTDAKGITSQDWNDVLGLLSKGNQITDGGLLHRWARDSIPQNEIDQKFTAQALPLVRGLADHFAAAAATGISLPGKFKGPTTFKLVAPTFAGASPGLPPAQPARPPIPAVTPPVAPVPPPGVGVPPAAPGLPAVPPAFPGARPAAPALPVSRLLPLAPAPAALPAASVPARPALPALPGRTAPRGARPVPPAAPTQGRRAAAKPTAPALPGRTRAPGVPATARPTSARGANGRPAVPPAAGPRLGGRTGQPLRATPLGRARTAGDTGRPGPRPSLSGRIGEHPGRVAPGNGAARPTPPEFRRPARAIAADATAAGPRQAPPTTSLGGRRGSPVPSPTPSRPTAGARPELTGRAAPHGVTPADTRPAVDSRRSVVGAVARPEEVFAPVESAPPMIERPGTPAVQPAGPALGRS